MSFLVAALPPDRVPSEQVVEAAGGDRRAIEAVGMINGLLVENQPARVNDRVAGVRGREVCQSLLNILVRTSIS